MQSIPDWVWKAMSIFIVPILLWAINAQLTNQQQELRLTQMEQKMVQTEGVLDSQKESLYSTKKDIEILKVRMDYVAQGIDDIKGMLQEKK
jgi:soluble cytochrome b562